MPNRSQLRTSSGRREGREALRDHAPIESLGATTAIYIRVSTADQGERFSPASQLKHTTALAERNGERYVVFEDHQSGKDTNRPQFTKLMARCKAGEFKRVVAYSVDRWSRRLTDAVGTYRKLISYGVTLECCTQHIEDTPHGRFSFAMIAAFAEMERELLLDRTSNGKKQKSSEGGFCGGRVPFGYRIVKEGLGSLEAVPEKAEVVKLVFKLYLDLRGRRKVAVKLNEDKVPSPGGRTWNEIMVSRVLKCASYLGEFAHYGSKIPCDRLISDDQFYLVQKLLSPSERQWRVGRGSQKYLLTTLVRCSHCGQRCYCRTVAKQHRYQCIGYSKNHLQPGRKHCTQTGVPARALERLVVQAVWDLCKDPARLEASHKAFLRTLRDDSESARVQGLIDRSRRQESAYEAQLDNPDLMYRHKELTEKLLAERTQRLTLERRLNQTSATLVSAEAFKAYSRGFKAEPNFDDFKACRTLLEQTSTSVVFRTEAKRQFVRVAGMVPVPQSLKAMNTGQINGYSSEQNRPHCFTSVPFEIDVEVAA